MNEYIKKLKRECKLSTTTKNKIFDMIVKQDSQQMAWY